MYFVNMAMVVLHWLSAFAGVLSITVVPVVNYFVGMERWTNTSICILGFVISAAVFLITAAIDLDD